MIKPKQIRRCVEVILGAIGDEWPRLPASAIAVHERDEAVWIIFRREGLGRRRLASTRLATTFPADIKGQRALKTFMRARRLDVIASARHQFLFLPTRFVTAAREVFAGTNVEIRVLPRA